MTELFQSEDFRFLAAYALHLYWLPSEAYGKDALIHIENAFYGQFEIDKICSNLVEARKKMNGGGNIKILCVQDRSSSNKYFKSTIVINTPNKY